ncbi:MAG TPA: ATP-binding protein [Dermatophilaceae bacterium]|nr:ATP-binding protein [Dermatophilaceae bacterium]
MWDAEPVRRTPALEPRPGLTPAATSPTPPGSAEPAPGPRSLRWPAGLSWARRAFGLATAVVGIPALTAALVLGRGSLSVGTCLLLYLLAVVVVAVIGGLVPGLLAALASVLLVNWFLVPPYGTLAVASRDAAIDLLVFVPVAVVVSVTVTLDARSRATAGRQRFESRLVSELGAAELGAVSLTAVLERVRDLFGMDAVALREPDRPTAAPLAVVGEVPGGPPTLAVQAGQGLELTAYGPPLLGTDRHLLGVLADLAARAWDEQRLAAEAARAHQLAETDRVRAALLAAVGHDLRTPLAAITASVSSLQQEDVAWTPEDRAELLGTIDESAARLSSLISNLLDMSRVQAGALSVHLADVSLDEVVARALIGVGGAVLVDVPEDLALVRGDAGLLERVVANLVDNAVRFSPAGQPVTVRAFVVGQTGDQGPGVGRERAVLTVEDRGPGIDPARRAEVFGPFQRLGDQRGCGLGLGLAIARGFTEAMGSELSAHETAGGGLTMRVELPLAPARAGGVWR